MELICLTWMLLYTLVLDANAGVIYEQPREPGPAKTFAVQYSYPSQVTSYYSSSPLDTLHGLYGQDNRYAFFPRIGSLPQSQSQVLIGGQESKVAIYHDSSSNNRGFSQDQLPYDTQSQLPQRVHLASSLDERRLTASDDVQTTQLRPQDQISQSLNVDYENQAPASKEEKSPASNKVKSSRRPTANSPLDRVEPKSRSSKKIPLVLITIQKNKNLLSSNRSKANSGKASSGHKQAKISEEKLNPSIAATTNKNLKFSSGGNVKPSLSSSGTDNVNPSLSNENAPVGNVLKQDSLTRTVSNVEDPALSQFKPPHAVQVTSGEWKPVDRFGGRVNYPASPMDVLDKVYYGSQLRHIQQQASADGTAQPIPSGIVFQQIPISDSGHMYIAATDEGSNSNDKTQQTNIEFEQTPISVQNSMHGRNPSNVLFNSQNVEPAWFLNWMNNPMQSTSLQPNSRQVSSQQQSEVPNPMQQQVLIKFQEPALDTRQPHGSLNPLRPKLKATLDQEHLIKKAGSNKTNVPSSSSNNSPQTKVHERSSLKGYSGAQATSPQSFRGSNTDTTLNANFDYNLRPNIAAEPNQPTENLSRENVSIKTRKNYQSLQDNIRSSKAVNTHIPQSFDREAKLNVRGLAGNQRATPAPQILGDMNVNYDGTSQFTNNQRDSNRNEGKRHEQKEIVASYPSAQEQIPISYESIQQNPKVNQQELTSNNFRDVQQDPKPIQQEQFLNQQQNKPIYQEHVRTNFGSFPVRNLEGNNRFQSMPESTRFGVPLNSQKSLNVNTAYVSLPNSGDLFSYDDSADKRDAFQSQQNRGSHRLQQAQNEKTNDGKLNSQNTNFNSQVGSQQEVRQNVVVQSTQDNTFDEPSREHASDSNFGRSSGSNQQRDFNSNWEKKRNPSNSDTNRNTFSTPNNQKNVRNADSSSNEDSSHRGATVHSPLYSVHTQITSKYNEDNKSDDDDNSSTEALLLVLVSAKRSTGNDELTNDDRVEETAYDAASTEDLVHLLSQESNAKLILDSFHQATNDQYRYH